MSTHDWALNPLWDGSNMRRKSGKLDHDPQPNDLILTYGDGQPEYSERTMPSGTDDFDSYSLVISDVAVEIAGVDPDRRKLFIRAAAISGATGGVAVGRQERIGSGNGYILGVAPLDSETKHAVWAKNVTAGEQYTVSVWMERNAG